MLVLFMLNALCLSFNSLSVSLCLLALRFLALPSFHSGLKLSYYMTSLYTVPSMFLVRLYVDFAETRRTCAVGAAKRRAGYFGPSAVFDRTCLGRFISLCLAG
jgi:hypothetical protein